MIIDSREDLMETHRDMYFHTGEVARVLEVSPTTVKRLETTGQLPASRNHNGWRFFNAGDVYDYLDKRGADT